MHKGSLQPASDITANDAMPSQPSTMLSAQQGAGVTKVVVRNTFVEVVDKAPQILRRCRSESDVSNSSGQNGSKSPSFKTVSFEESFDSSGETIEKDPTSAESVQVAQHLIGGYPSRGSSKHFAGACQSCSFFRKGRCSRQDQCTFCHYPHEMPARPSKSARMRGKVRLAKAAAAGQLTVSEVPSSVTTGMIFADSGGSGQDEDAVPATLSLLGKHFSCKMSL